MVLCWVLLVVVVVVLVLLVVVRRGGIIVVPVAGRQLLSGGVPEPIRLFSFSVGKLWLESLVVLAWIRIARSGGESRDGKEDGAQRNNTSYLSADQRCSILLLLLFDCVLFF